MARAIDPYMVRSRPIRAATPAANVEVTVYTHPRDPYTRVDILASSRHVRIEVDGVTVADSRQPRILFETGLPSRPGRRGRSGR
jgi:hypothetical protein